MWLGFIARNNTVYMWHNFCRFIMLRPQGSARALSLAFVRPSVAYIANNSRTRSPSVPKFEVKIARRCDWHTSFKVKRSKIKVTRPINADTHRAPYLPNGNAYELQTSYTDGRRRSGSATGALITKVKDQGHKVTWSVWAVLTKCCTCVISGRRGHTVSAEHGGHTSRCLSALRLWRNCLQPPILIDIINRDIPTSRYCWCHGPSL